ncbi:MAG: response regulator [Gemmatimonadaceae bacterium]|nr:response regulator [Gemmatimonadaceae bacterium]
MPGRTGGIRVLIAEDHAEMADVLSTYLTAAGYAVAVARDGVEAGVLAVRLAPAVAILDANMPGCTGWALLHAWKRDGEEAETLGAIPRPGRPPAVIMLTGDDVFPPESALADAVLRKPASLRAIAAAVAAVVGATAP